jgi:hypothetical protein
MRSFALFVGRDHGARLMRVAGLAGIVRGKRRTKTTAAGQAPPGTRTGVIGRGTHPTARTCAG